MYSICIRRRAQYVNRNVSSRVPIYTVCTIILRMFLSVVCRSCLLKTASFPTTFNNRYAIKIKCIQDTRQVSRLTMPMGYE